MGEKEQAATRESSMPSVSERAAGTGQVTGDPDFDTGSMARVKGSKSNTSERQAGTALSTDADQAGDTDAEAAESGIVKSKSNITNNREAALGDEGEGTLGESAAAVVKTKTKSNQSNDRLGQTDDPDGPSPGGIATGDPDFDTALASNQPGDPDADDDGTLEESAAAVVKNKTKSNQSNDRLGQEGDLDGPSPGGIATGDPDFDTARASNLPGDPDDDGDGTLDEGSLSRLKQKTKSNQSNDRLGQDADPDGSGAVEAAINNTKSNIKNRLGGGGGGLDIANRDPGAAGDSAGIAVSDEGVPADKPSRQ